jgi:hypothetical protein
MLARPPRPVFESECERPGRQAIKKLVRPAQRPGATKWQIPCFPPKSAT